MPGKQPPTSTKTTNPRPILFDLKGFECLEYRSTKDSELPVSWNMEAVWRREEQRERSRRARLKEQFEMGAHDSLGQLVDCPQECAFYNIDAREWLTEVQVQESNTKRNH